MPIKDLRQDTIKPLPYLGTKNAQCIYWDRQLPGFGVRVFPSGRRMFVCSYRVQGRKRLATLGRGDVLRLDVARKKAVSYLGQVAEGVDPQAPKESIKAAGTVKSLAETYIRRHAKLKKSTWVEDESYLARHLIPRFGTRLALTITTDDMAALHAEIGSKHPYAANRLLEVVRKMYNLGRKWGLVPHDKANPASGVERFPETKRRRFVTPDELPQLSKAIDQEADEYVRHAIWLLLLTGLRRGELLGAKWSDIDWKQRTLIGSQDQKWRGASCSIKSRRHLAPQIRASAAGQSVHHLRQEAGAAPRQSNRRMESNPSCRRARRFTHP